MSAGLLLDSLLDVHEEERRVGVGGAREHVLYELLVTGRIDDAEVTILPREPHLGDVDRHALELLGLEGV